jgi:DNA-binding MarR family transcriptional regulator
MKKHTKRMTAAEEAWSLLFHLVLAQKARFGAAMAELELTPVLAHALRRLEPNRPIQMNELADALYCDASNVTGIVDRLEARGLVERRPARHDRRVKALVLTPEGVELRAKVTARMSEPPEAIAELSAIDQRLLRDVLRRALRGERPAA